MKIKDLIQELRDIAKQNLIDRDMWNICNDDIEEELFKLVRDDCRERVIKG